MLLPLTPLHDSVPAQSFWSVQILRQAFLPPVPLVHIAPDTHSPLVLPAVEQVSPICPSLAHDATAKAIKNMDKNRIENLRCGAMPPRKATRRLPAKQAPPPPGARPCRPKSLLLQPHAMPTDPSHRGAPALYRSNRQELLAAQLCRDIGANLPDAMQAVDVVVGSRGMAAWLRGQLARHLGVCCNVRFHFVDGAMRRIAAALGVAAAGDDWQPDRLGWLAAELLDDPAVAPSLPAATAARWKGEAHVGRPKAAFARAAADLLDRYLHDRPDWFRDGAAGLAQAAALCPWQAELFALAERRLAGQAHFAAHADALRDALDSGAPLQGLPALHVFGLARMPAALWPLLASLGRRVPVRVYLLSATADYLGDLKNHRDRCRDRAQLQQAIDEQAGQFHPLLQSLGRLARDVQLQALETFGDDGTWLPAPPPAGQPTALQTLQADLQRNTPQPAALPWPAGDDSLQIHACYGAARQVEALRDALLHLFAADPALKPRDVVVMTPDLATFAPLCQTLLPQPLPQGAAGDRKTPPITVAVSDLGVRATNPVADAALRVLELCGNRLTRSWFLELLALWPVQRKFKLAAEEVAQIRQWIDAAAVRWGADEQDRAAQGQPADAQNTFERGLQRVALGVAMADDGGLPWMDAVLAVDQAEGQAALFGKLAALVGTAVRWRKAMDEPAALATWSERLLQLQADLTEVPAKLGWMAAQWRQAAAELAHGGRLCSLPVSADAVLHSLAGQFANPAPTDRPPDDAVTVCAMQPMRAVPCQVLCLLGIDDAGFPRRPPHTGHDLLQAQPRTGDRDPRDEDRHLLLEAVLSARRNLLIFYTGCDAKTSKELAPAVPVAELSDAIAGGLAALHDAGHPPPRPWVRRHPLQPFGLGNFTAGAGQAPFSFDAGLCAALAKGLFGGGPLPGLFDGGELLPPAQMPAELAADELVRFLRHPCRSLLQRRLKLYLPDDEAAVGDREPLEVGILAQLELSREAMAGAENAAGGGPNRAVLRARAKGGVPLGQAGSGPLGKAAEFAEAMAAATAALGPRQPSEAAAATLLRQEAPTRLVATLDHLRGGVAVLASERKASKDDLQLAILARLLVARAAGSGVTAAAVVGAGEGAVVATQKLAVPMPAEQAQQILTQWVELYATGQRRPLPLFVHASAAFAKARSEGKDGWSEADEAYLGSERNGGGDSGDRSVAAIFGSQPWSARPAADRQWFAELALQVYGPVVAARAA